MPSSAATGNITGSAVDQTLATITVAGVYKLRVDATNMVNGDTLELAWQVKVVTGGAYIEENRTPFSNVQARKSLSSIPIDSLYGVKFLLKNPSGKTFDWEVTRLDA